MHVSFKAMLGTVLSLTLGSIGMVPSNPAGAQNGGITTYKIGSPDVPGDKKGQGSLTSSGAKDTSNNNEVINVNGKNSKEVCNASGCSIVVKHSASRRTGLTLNKNIHAAEHGVAGNQSTSVHPSVHVSIPHPEVSVHPR